MPSLAWKKWLKYYNYTAFKIEELIVAAHTYLSQTTFSFQGHICIQSKDLAMGSALFFVLIDIYMH